MRTVIQAILGFIFIAAFAHVIAPSNGYILKDGFSPFWEVELRTDLIIVGYILHSIIIGLMKKSFKDFFIALVAPPIGLILLIIFFTIGNVLGEVSDRFWTGVFAFIILIGYIAYMATSSD